MTTDDFEAKLDELMKSTNLAFDKSTKATGASLYALQRQSQASAEQFRKVADATGAVTKAFNIAAVASAGMAALANPTAFATFRDSLELVAMQLGRAFLPALIKGAYYAQEFAHWLQNLSPETVEL